MKDQYDFSKGERGKFFRPSAESRLPIYLNADIEAYWTERAAEKGVPAWRTGECTAEAGNANH